MRIGMIGLVVSAVWAVMFDSPYAVIAYLLFVLSYVFWEVWE